MLQTYRKKGQMTMIERNFIQAIGDNFAPAFKILEKIYFHYRDGTRVLSYLVKNGIKGEKFVNIVVGDFKGDLDNFVKYALKTKTEKRYKL